MLHPTMFKVRLVGQNFFYKVQATTPADALIKLKANVPPTQAFFFDSGWHRIKTEGLARSWKTCKDFLNLHSGF
jgi:hypothetical protein